MVTEKRGSGQRVFEGPFTAFVLALVEDLRCDHAIKAGFKPF